MKVKSKGWALLAGLLVLLVSSSALAGSVAEKRRFQNSFVCVNIHNGLIKVISRRQHNRCAPGWKRYRVSDIFGKGMKGAKGTPGTPGPRGPAGPSGGPGATGATGASGATGATGPQGFMGLQGLIGPTGPKGDVGPMGPLGPQGEQGPAGLDGANGLDGATGQAGGQGPMGPAGANGQNGQDGAMGPAGPKGEQGVPGPQGSKGDTGPAGPAGAPGPMGPQGPAGADGLNGSSVITATNTSTVVDANAIVTATANCPADHIAISGGFLEAGATSPSVIESHATPAFAGWVSKAKTQGNSQQSVSLTVYAYCVPS
jgi:hypothetical protein